MNCTIRKQDDELQIVYGEVYSPDVPDAQGDFMSAREIQKMAHRFMKSMALDQVDENHDNSVNGSTVVESFIAREDDPIYLPNSWVVGVHVPDNGVWHKVKSGELNGFSMECLVHNKTDMLVEIDLPDLVKGTTLKGEEDHDHEFELTFDGHGKVVGGRTSITNGHFHEVKKHTVTEPAGDGHSHRFSFIEFI